MNYTETIKNFGRSVTKFGLTSLLATAVDFATFMLLFSKILPVFWAEIAAAFCGMIINFFMQKRFVFIMERKVHWAFILSLLFSFVLMFLGATAMSNLIKIPLFAEYLILAKVLVMGVKFILNYFTKKWIFEKNIRH